MKESIKNVRIVKSSPAVAIVAPENGDFNAPACANCAAALFPGAVLQGAANPLARAASLARQERVVFHEMVEQRFRKWAALGAVTAQSVQAFRFQTTKLIGRRSPCSISRLARKQPSDCGTRMAEYQPSGVR